VLTLDSALASAFSADKEGLQAFDFKNQKIEAKIIKSNSRYDLMVYTVDSLVQQ
jgi:hypothetical protein